MEEKQQEPQVLEHEDLYLCEDLQNTTMNYGKTRKFLLYFLLTMISASMLSFANLAVFFELVNVSPYEEVGLIEVKGVLFLQTLFLVLPTYGLIRLYLASKHSNKEHMFHAFSVLAIYVKILIAVLWIGIISVGILFLIFVILAQLMGFLLGLILVAMIYVQYRLLKSIDLVIKDFKRIFDDSKSQNLHKKPNFQPLIQFLSINAILITIGFFVSLINIDSLNNPIPGSLDLIFATNYASPLFQFYNLGILVFAIYLLGDLNLYFEEHTQSPHV